MGVLQLRLRTLGMQILLQDYPCRSAGGFMKNASVVPENISARTLERRTSAAEVLNVSSR
jgi:hypothetical protein